MNRAWSMMEWEQCAISDTRDALLMEGGIRLKCHVEDEAKGRGDHGGPERNIVR